MKLLQILQVLLIGSRIFFVLCLILMELLQILLIPCLILMELLQILQVLLVGTGSLIVLVLGLVVGSQILQILLMGSFVRCHIVQIVLVSLTVLQMLCIRCFIGFPICQILLISGIILRFGGQVLLISGGIFAVLCHRFFISFHCSLVFGLCLLVNSLFLIVGFLCQPVKLLGSSIVVIDSLVVVIHSFVVVAHFFIVIADDLIVLFGIGAVGIRQFGSFRQLQLGIGQQTVGILFIFLRCCIVTLLNLLVLFDSLVIFCGDVRIGLADLLVGDRGLHDGGYGIAHFGISGRNVGAQRFRIGNLSGLSLCGQRERHCDSNSSGAAGLGQMLHVILLCHNFFSSQYKGKNSGGRAIISFRI